MKIKASDIGSVRHTVIGDLTVKDFSIVHHASGKPFIRYLCDGLLEALAKDMKNNVSADYDNLVIIEGNEGSGKSNFTWECCKALNPEFDFKRQLTYTVDDLKTRLQDGDDKHSVFWLDEAYDIANKRDWNTDRNKMFVTLLVKMRSRGWTLMMDVPRFEDMDVYIRDHRARYVVTCCPCEFEHTGYKERGFFELKKRDKTGRWQHIGYGSYDRMPEDVDAEYRSVKEQSQDRSLKALAENDTSPGARYRKKYEDQSKRLNKAVMLLYDAGVSREDIMTTLGISQKTFYTMLEKGKKTGDLDEDGD